MNDRRQMIPMTGFLATVAAAVYMVAQLNGQTVAAGADFTNAAVAEVRQLLDCLTGEECFLSRSMTAVRAALPMLCPIHAGNLSAQSRPSNPSNVWVP